MPLVYPDEKFLARALLTEIKNKTRDASYNPGLIKELMTAIIFDKTLTAAYGHGVLKGNKGALRVRKEVDIIFIYTHKGCIDEGPYQEMVKKHVKEHYAKDYRNFVERFGEFDELVMVDENFYMLNSAKHSKKSKS